MSRDLFIYIKTSENIETLKQSIAVALEVEIKPPSPTSSRYGVFSKPEKFFWADVGDGAYLVIDADEGELDYEYKIGIFPCCYDQEDYDDEYNENLYRGAAQYVFDQLKATGRYSLLIFLDIEHVLDRFDLPPAPKSEP
jgi:hypothetical protein